MVPFFVVVGFLMLGGAIVAWATRRPPTRAYIRRREQGVAWNAPMTSVTVTTDPSRVTGSVFRAQPEAFTQSPGSRPQAVSPTEPEVTPPASFPSLVLTPSTPVDPFAHAPAVSDLGGAPLEMRK